MADADKILRQVLENILRENNYKHVETKAITSGGANYTSALYLATMSSPDKEDLNLFAKVAIVGGKMRELMQNFFTSEGFVYNKLAKIYEDIQKKQGYTEDCFVFPKFYGSNPKLYEETIVLENLVPRGYYTYNRFKSLDWDHAASAIEALAKFHALSFAFQKENPKEFEIAVENLKLPKRDDSLKETFAKMVAKALGVIKEEYRGRVVKFLEDGGEEIYLKYYSPLEASVLIHGDYRPSNLLFKREGSKVHTVPVDFQTVHSGSPVIDLIYFIILGTDSGFRAEHYEQLVELYYAQLALALSKLRVDSTEVYPREMFDRELKEMLPYAVFVGVAVLPIVTVEADNAPKLDGDGNMDNFVIPANELFAERFSGIVEDCVRWGII